MPDHSHATIDTSAAGDAGIDSAPITSNDPAADQRAQLQSAIAHAVHYLPTQGPISVFVHHNTLHPFEHLSFADAVLEGRRVYGCEPYLSEDRYHDELRRGRISVDDLRQVLMDDLGDDADDLVAIFGTRYALRLAMLQTTLHTAPDAELNWLLAETDLLKRFREELPPQQCDLVIQQTKAWVMRQRGLGSNHASPSESARAVAATSPTVAAMIHAPRATTIESWSDAEWESFVLKLTWELCQHGVRLATAEPAVPDASIGLPELLRSVTGEDPNRLVNEVLIRFCGGFLDQGYAGWSLPHRDQGFAKAFARLLLTPGTITAGWTRGVQQDLLSIRDGEFDPLDTIAEQLRELGVSADERDQAVVESLLALRGWAGMIWQMETATPWLPYPAATGSLHQYLAIRLLLLRYAIADIGKRNFGTDDLAQIKRFAQTRYAGSHEPSTNQQTYGIFQLAELGGWTPEQLCHLTSAQWKCLRDELVSFSSLERRRVWHLAYERHFRASTLNAVAIHAKRRRELDRKLDSPPAYAAVFCIDDREESFRRHLEEVDPECTTASAAGFFAVAMYYQGADHAHFRPLCPNIITPQHYVREEPLFSATNVSERRAQRRRRIGQLTHQVHYGSRTLVGGWVTGVFGALATFPLVARIMAPRLTSQIRESLGTWVRPPATELHIERTASQPGPESDALGYSLDEMAGIVIRILQDTGLTNNLPPIVVFFGHGSSSLNNPHESAYNCGACSGGRGGPNARAFAIMANDSRVRKLTAAQGLELPADVWFVGGYHNTCSDKVEYYDLDLLPRTHRPLFRRIEKSINLTRARNAHERARRFESAPLNLSTAAALEHVEQRAEDLSQARPEYNHATNSLVFVGRREWSRGLFLDRRVFLTSYDPGIDDEQVTILTRILQAAIPVCAGISLEYYFSTVDTEGYGCGSKLPHNVASMIGVMTGAASDLRPGLSQQMVEIHEPMRILFVIETTPAKMQAIIDANPGIARLVNGNWVQLALLDPSISAIQVFRDGRFEPYLVDSDQLPEVNFSMDWYRGQRDHLGCASIAERTLTAPLGGSTAFATHAGVAR